MIRHGLIFLLLLALPAAASADPCPDIPGGEEDCTGASPWYDANRLAVHFKSPDGEADWLYEITAGGEYRVTLDERFGDAPVSGVIMVIGGGTVMLTRGLDPEPGSETASLDLAALIQQLTLKLLQHAYPQGRGQVLGVEAFRLRRENMSIGAANSRAATSFAPPWMLTGAVDNGNYDWVDFELDFEAPDEDYRAQLTGRWEEIAHPAEFRDAMNIGEWRIWPLVPQPYPPPLKPGLAGEDQRIVTLGALRRIIGGG